MKPQASLGSRVVNNKPTYNQMQIGRVTSTGDYDKYGRIEVIFLDYSRPAPVWVNGDIDRKPVAGDQVLVGFIQGRSDSPYLAGFIRNASYTSNCIKVEQDCITLQLPASTTDAQGHMLDDSLKTSRMRVEITTAGVLINGLRAVKAGDTVTVNVPTIGLCSGTIS